MPSPRKNKTQIGGYVDDAIAEAADALARKRGFPTRTALLEALITEAAQREGLPVSPVPPSYYPDRLAERGAGDTVAQLRAKLRALLDEIDADPAPENPPKSSSPED